MRTDALVGIDLGQTRTKVLVVDLSGRQLAVAFDTSEPDRPHDYWAERDLDATWATTASTIRSAVRQAGDVTILGVGVSGHSDGVYLVDDRGRPVRHAVLATDARARRDAAGLATGALGDRLLSLTGQVPMAASPGVLLRWLRRHEPHALDATRWVLSSTDWLRLRLTGTVTTDLTMAAASFVDLGTETWSLEALGLHGLDDLLDKLPPIVDGQHVVGGVTDAAAMTTGLPPGTAVVAGSHDVDAGAVGLGATAAGSASILLGTYAINQVMATAPVTDPRWQTRPFLGRDRWLHMSTSPAGAGSLDWAVDRVGPHDGAGRADLASAVAEADRVTSVRSLPLFLPFVHGGPPTAPLGGAWIDLRGAHRRPHLLHAVMEGVAFSHRSHMEALRSRMPVPAPVRVGGGGARSESWTQLVADCLGLVVEVTEGHEASALGAAVVAGVGVGAYADLEDGVARTVRVGRRQEPQDEERALLDGRFERFTEAARLLAPLDEIGATPTG